MIANTLPPKRKTENWNKISFTELISDRTKDGAKLQTNEYNKSGVTAIIDQGQDFIAGYTDETEGAFTDIPAIIFGDHTRVFKYVDFPFFLGADGVKVLKTNREINYKYLYYYFLQAYLLELFDLSRFSEGAGVPTFNRNIVHEKEIIDVSLEHQNDFAAFVQQIDKSKLSV
ncbi:MAG: restriction endonuclease subunit S [Treponema sp.]|nr:restriction endonuclease subunit S [Treponema sp.]